MTSQANRTLQRPREHIGAKQDLPQRIQQQRRAGWRLPDNAVSVAGTSRFHNPHRPKVRSPEVNAEAVRRYEADLQAGRLGFTVDDVRRDLKGKHLACFCEPGLPCHADVLLRIANSDA